MTTAMQAAPSQRFVEHGDPVAIQAVDLVKDYGKGDSTVHALRHVNVAFEKGRFTAIMGPSGSGKSTLMHTLSGLDSATSGHIMFQGVDLTTLNDKQLTMLRRHDIGFIFQSFNLLPMFTAKQNILMPLTLAGKKPDVQWFDLLVRTLGLSDRLSHHPNELSGGQQQRVASSVKELGQTIVMVTHDPVAASYADRAIVFADGQIVADVNAPTAAQMSDLLMQERERAARGPVPPVPPQA